MVQRNRTESSMRRLRSQGDALVLMDVDVMGKELGLKVHGTNRFGWYGWRRWALREVVIDGVGKD